MQLFINTPKSENEKIMFNTCFAKLQATLIKQCIDDLNVDNKTKKAIIDNLLSSLHGKEVKK